MEETLTEYKTFLSDIGVELYQPRENSDSFVPQEIKTEYEKALERLAVILPFEESIEVSGVNELLCQGLLRELFINLKCMCKLCEDSPHNTLLAKYFLFYPIRVLTNQ